MMKFVFLVFFLVFFLSMVPATFCKSLFEIVPEAVADNTAPQNATMVNGLLAAASALTGQVKAARVTLSTIQADATNAPCTRDSILAQMDILWNNAVPQLDLLQYAPNVINQAIAVRDVLHSTTCNLLIADASLRVAHTMDDARRADLLGRMKGTWAQFDAILNTMDDLLLHEPRNPAIVNQCAYLQGLVVKRTAAVRCFETANFTRIWSLLKVSGSLSQTVNWVWNVLTSAQSDSWADPAVQSMYNPSRSLLSSTEGLLRDFNLKYDKWLTGVTARDQLLQINANLDALKDAIIASTKFDGGRKGDLSSRVTSCKTTLKPVIDAVLKRIGSK